MATILLTLLVLFCLTLLGWARERRHVLSALGLLVVALGAQLVRSETIYDYALVHSLAWMLTCAGALSLVSFRRVRTAPDHEADGNRPFRILVALLVGGPVTLLLLLNAVYLADILYVKATLEASWSMLFSADDPAFRQGFADNLPHAPGRGLRIYFLALVAMVAWHGFLSIRAGASRLWIYLPALAPLLVALAFWSRPVYNTVVALAQQGLRNPGAAGAGVSEAAAILGLGIVLSGLCAFGLRWAAQRHDRSE